MTIGKYVNWVRADALPRWIDTGFDARRGCFHERLSWTAEALAVPQRAMVQARQIYVFAHAAALGWFPEGAEAATVAMDRLQRRYAETANNRTSFHFSLDAAGNIHSSVRDSYTHAFVLLAAAHLYQLTGDKQLLVLAERVCRFIDHELTDPQHGGVLDAIPAPPDAAKRQNPQMHLLEAYVALERAAPGHGYLDRAAGVVGLFDKHLFSRADGVLLEHFAADWAPHPDQVKARLFEPGHHHEWIWLLKQMEDLSGNDHGPTRAALGASADRYGVTAAGLIYDEVDAAGTVATLSHRLWPHTEAIMAAAVAVQQDDAAVARANTIARVLLDHFVGRPFAGGWIDHLQPDLSPRVDYVPASSLYHLFLAAAEADAVFAKAADGAPAPAADTV